MSANLTNFVIIAVFAAVGGAIYATHLEPQYNPKDFFINERIVGGQDAEVTEYPWSVAITSGLIFRFLVCGGSTISQWHVLTAAHCIDAVVWGEDQLSLFLLGAVGSSKWSSSTHMFRFKGFRNHPEWNSTIIKNDLGILYVDGEIPLSKEVAVIPLSFKWVEGGQKAKVAGWGRIEAWGTLPATLQHLEVTTINPDECQRIYDNAIDVSAPPIERLLEICTYHSVGKGMCNGDSGSALVLVSTGEQVGVVSWGLPCARGMPDVFASLYSHKKFIEESLSL